MSYLVSIAVLLLLLPVAIVLVGMANLRRHAVRKEEPEAPASPSVAEATRRRPAFPLPKPPALGERAVVTARLARPFSLKSQLSGPNSYEAKSQA